MKILRWLAFGAAAYGVLRVMRAYGILEQPTGRVLDAIDGTVKKGVDYAQTQIQDQFPQQFAQGKQAIKSRVNQASI